MHKALTQGYFSVCNISNMSLQQIISVRTNVERFCKLYLVENYLMIVNKTIIYNTLQGLRKLYLR